MKIALLDDYQRIAMQSADWGSLPAGTDVQAFSDTIADRDALVKRLEPFDVIVAMRERTRFPAEVIDALPNLRLLISTGARNASIDAEACARRKIPLVSAHGASRGGVTSSSERRAKVSNWPLAASSERSPARTRL